MLLLSQYFAAGESSLQITVTLLQPLKIPQPKSLTESGMTTRSSEEQPRKAVSSMRTTESGIIISFKPEQV